MPSNETQLPLDFEAPEYGIGYLCINDETRRIKFGRVKNAKRLIQRAKEHHLTGYSMILTMPVQDVVAWETNLINYIKREWPTCVVKQTREYVMVSHQPAIARHILDSFSAHATCEPEWEAIRTARAHLTAILEADAHQEWIARNRPYATDGTER